MRLPSVIFGVLTLIVAYRLATQIFRDPAVTLAALAVFSVAEQLIWFSQTARPYALALLLTLLSFGSFLHFLQSRRMRHAIVYALTTALLIYAHFLFGVVVVVQVVLVMAKSGWRELLSKHWLWTLSITAMLCLPLSGQLIALYGRRQALDWIPHVVQTSQGATLARGFADPWALVLATVALLAIGIERINLRDSSTREVLKFLLAWLIIPLAGIWALATLIGVSFFEARYILFVYPAAYYLWAWLMLHVKATNWRRALPACAFVTATMGISLIPHLFENGTFRHAEQLGWERAGKTMSALGRPGDQVVFYSVFVEADQFTEKPQDAFLLSYVSWPLVAHLPPNHGLSLISLPHHQNDHTNRYIRSIEQRVATHERVWVIGPDKQREYFNDEMISQFGFHRVDTFPSELSEYTIKVSLLVRSRQGS